MLYKCFLKETVPKSGGLVDFSTTSLLTILADTHAHRYSLFKTGRKQLVDQSLSIEKMKEVL